MNDLRSITLRVFSQSLLFTVLAFFSFSVFSQQSKKIALPKPFEKPMWLNCDIKNENGAKDNIREKIFYEYGAVYLSKAFIGQREEIPCWFNNETDETKVGKFIEKLTNDRASKFDFGNFYLQPQAKASLLKVFDEMGGYQFVARNCNSNPKTCTNNINNDWALRDYEQTKCNWLDLGDNLEECNQKNLDLAKIEERIQRNDLFPKMFTTAIPGGSQHHLGLAIDVNNKEVKNDGIWRVCGDACVKSLERNGWFRTIRYDAFHYTYLGYPESSLRSKGLKKVQCKDTFTYWVPRVSAKIYPGYTDSRWSCANVN